MKIHDISQEVFSCAVYPGDESPEKRELLRMAKGDTYNLTAFSMCAHNGTHVDAPFHFFADGKTADSLPLEKTVGFCYVTDTQTGPLSAIQAKTIVDTAKNMDPKGAGRILIKGDAVVTEESAQVFADAGTDLVGTETLSVGPTDAPMAVHKILLSADVVLLEGIRLNGINEGIYLLSAAPLCLAGSDGSPCRAILIEI